MLTISRSGARVVLAGEADSSNAGQLSAALEAALGEAPHELVVDLAELRFMDSRGVGILAELTRRLGDAALVLENPNPLVRNLLHLVGLDRFPNVRVTPDEVPGK